MQNRIVFVVILVGIIGIFTGANCQGIPKPQGVSVQGDDGGVETCVTWAEKKYCPCDGGNK